LALLAASTIPNRGLREGAEAQNPRGVHEPLTQIQQLL